MSSDNNKNLEEENETTSGRVRTQSECSGISDDGSSNVTGKRQRTTSQQYMVASGMTAASPPKFVSLEEIMKAANGMRDMALVHQIAIDKDFRLERAEPSENSVQKVVKETMHRAFWDLLQQELDENPPCYTQAMVLLQNIKEGLFGVLLPQHTKLKQQISEVLDVDLIRQQAENDTLDFKHYAQYVISVMAKLCAPVRDEKIKELTEMKDVVQTFRSILETLDLMALDMANFTIEMVKPDIIAHSVELERKKFADYLAVQNDGLQYTRNWLLKHIDDTDTSSNNADRATLVRNLTKKAFAESCIDLLEWDNRHSFPETFLLDEARLSELELTMNRLILIGTILLVTGSCVGADLQSISSFKQTVKNHASILLESVNSEKQVETALSNIATQILTDVKDVQQAHGLVELSEEAMLLLTEQIKNIAKSDHRIRQLVRQRVRDFLLQIIQSSTAAPQKVPSGLTALQNELTTIAGRFLRIVSHNSTVFSDYYMDIISAALPK